MKRPFKIQNQKPGSLISERDPSPETRCACCVQRLKPTLVKAESEGNLIQQLPAQVKGCGSATQTVAQVRASEYM